MKEEILSGINDPRQLEKLYRNNKTPFKREFSDLYPNLKGNPLADFWNERLNYEGDEINWGTRNELLFVALLAVVAGILVKLPAIFPINEEFYYPRNASFFVLPMLTAYFAWKNNLSLSKISFIGLVTFVSLLYINSLPANVNSDTLLLACIHLPLLLWVILGVAFTGDELGNYRKRLEYLRFNGDLAVMSAMLVLACILTTGITLGLFELIGLPIKEFYFNYVVLFGLPVVPIAATFLTQSNPQLVNKVSPVIAKIFSPLVLTMLLIYLGAIVYSGKDPYTDREFLLVFNVLLIGVMALIFFSVAESSAKSTSVVGKWILLLLSIVTVVVNGIALSAILFRISEWGLTPNRMAVLGGNILVLAHLLIVMVMLFKTVTGKKAITEVGRIIVLYMPVYFIWTIIVVFLFPLLFGFR